MERNYLRTGIISGVACLLGVFLLFTGCGDQEEPPQQTAKVVRKKIGSPSGSSGAPSSSGSASSDRSAETDSEVIRKKIAMPAPDKKPSAEDSSPEPGPSEELLAKTASPETASPPPAVETEKESAEGKSPREDLTPSAETPDKEEAQPPVGPASRKAEEQEKAAAQTDQAPEVGTADDEVLSDTADAEPSDDTQETDAEPVSPETASADAKSVPEGDKPSVASGKTDTRKTSEDLSPKTGKKDIPPPPESAAEKSLQDSESSPQKTDGKKVAQAESEPSPAPKKDDSMPDSEDSDKKDKPSADTESIPDEDEKASELSIAQKEPSEKETSDTMPIAANKTGGLSIASIIGTEKEEKVAEKRDFYSPVGKVDPFAPLFREETGASKPEPESAPQEEDAGTDGKKPGRKKRIPQTPLERVDLSQLKLVGIIRAESGNKAMVEEASGKGYIITRGTYIGINSGKVSEILRDRVIVEEEGEDPSGDLVIRKRELKLQKPLGEDYYEM